MHKPPYSNFVSFFFFITILFLFISFWGQLLDRVQSSNSCITIQPDPSNVAHLDMATNFPDQGLYLEDRLKVGNYMNYTYKAAPFDNEGPYDMQVVFRIFVQ